MKNILFTFILLIICNQIVSGKKIQVFFQNASFNTPTQESYIETYITAIGNSIIFQKNSNNKYQASILITMLFMQDGQIKTFKKYNLLSPEVDDTLKAYPNFIDQQRIPIASGSYNFELFVSDNNNPVDSFSLKDIIKIDFPLEDVSFSGIQMLEKFETSVTQNILTKNGYDLYPYVSDFYPENINKIIFYTEIYNSSKIFKNDEFLVRYGIASVSKNRALNEFSRFKKLKPQDVNILLAEFDIENLPSGNYNLAIELVSKDNKVIKLKKSFFQRSKTIKRDDNIDYTKTDISNAFVSSINSLDTLRDYIKSLRPIATEIEKKHMSNVLRNDSIKYLQQYLYSFWQTRNFADPQEEWSKYQKQVDLVNRLYKTPIERGYDTDRGRIYLQYGSPNSITENKFEDGMWPNEIWHYYSIKSQSNIKFIFYNPDLTTNVYHLLHSDLKGEIQNPNWANVLYRAIGKQNNGIQDQNGIQ